MVAARLFDWILHPIRMRYLSYFRLHAFNVWPPNFNIIWLFRYDDKKITSHFEAWHWNIRSLGLRFPNYQISILIFRGFFSLPRSVSIAFEVRLWSHKLFHHIVQNLSRLLHLSIYSSRFFHAQLFSRYLFLLSPMEKTIWAYFFPIFHLTDTSAGLNKL